MEPRVGRGSDGRRLFTPEFKRELIGRVQRGEASLSELSREFGISRTLLSRWKHLLERGGETAVGAGEEVVPVSKLREAEARIRELERTLGRKTMEIEILRAAQAEVKKRPRFYGVSGS